MAVTADRRTVLGMGLAGAAWPALAAGPGAADPMLTAAPDRIKDIKVVRTATGGRIVYEA